MTTPDHAIGEWRSLYTSAIRFRELQPWAWMSEVDLFIVRSQRFPEPGYCCIIGGLGEVFGLIVYLGNEGLALYQDISGCKAENVPVDFHYRINCLKGEFADRRELAREDLALMKDLDLRVRGRKQYPVFRRHKPGFMPWFVESSEVKFLTQCFQRACELAHLYQRNLASLTAIHDGLVPSFVEGAGNRWEFEMVRPQYLENRLKDAPRICVDEIQLKRIQKSAPRSGEVWEADFFYLPKPVRGKGCPYFPRTTFLIERKSTFILDSELMQPEEEPVERLWRSIARAIETHGIQPKEIHIKDPATADALSPYAKKLGILIKQKRELSVLEQTKRELLSSI